MLDDLSSGKRENLTDALAAGASLIEGDITDPEAVDRAFSEAAPERVFHLAAQIDVRRSVADPAYDLGINVGGTLALLERLRAQGSGKLVFASTGGAIYGEGNGRELPLSEDAECRPDAPYGQSKLAAEGYLGLYRRMYDIDAIAMRLGNVYGPRQDPLGEAGVVAIFCNAISTGATPRVFGNGEQTRDYIFVGDVASAFIAGAGVRPLGRSTSAPGSRRACSNSAQGSARSPAFRSSRSWHPPAQARSSASRSTPRAPSTSSAGARPSPSRRASPRPGPG